MATPNLPTNSLIECCPCRVARSALRQATLLYICLSGSVARWPPRRPNFPKVATFERQWLPKFPNGLQHQFGLQVATWKNPEKLAKNYSFGAVFGANMPIFIWLFLKIFQKISSKVKAVKTFYTLFLGHQKVKFVDNL